MQNKTLTPYEKLKLHEKNKRIVLQQKYLQKNESINPHKIRYHKLNLFKQRKGDNNNNDNQQDIFKRRHTEKYDETKPIYGQIKWCNQKDEKFEIIMRQSIRKLNSYRKQTHINKKLSQFTKFQQTLKLQQEIFITSNQNNINSKKKIHQTTKEIKHQSLNLKKNQQQMPEFKVEKCHMNKNHNRIIWQRPNFNLRRSCIIGDKIYISEVNRTLKEEEGEQNIDEYHQEDKKQQVKNFIKRNKYRRCIFNHTPQKKQSKQLKGLKGCSLNLQKKMKSSMTSIYKFPEKSNTTMNCGAKINAWDVNFLTEELQ